MRKMSKKAQLVITSEIDNLKEEIAAIEIKLRRSELARSHDQDLAQRRDKNLLETIKLLREMVDDGFATMITVGVALKAGVTPDSAVVVIKVAAHEMETRRKTAAMLSMPEAAKKDNERD